MKQKMADSWLIFLFGLNLRCKMFFKIISKHAYSIYCNMGLKIRSWNRIQNKFFRIHNTGISLYFWQNYRTSFFIIQYITITVQNLLQNFSNIGQYTKRPDIWYPAKPDIRHNQYPVHLVRKKTYRFF